MDPPQEPTSHADAAGGVSAGSPPSSPEVQYLSRLDSIKRLRSKRKERAQAGAVSPVLGAAEASDALPGLRFSGQLELAGASGAAKGAFSVVVKAEDRARRRVYAVKFLRSDVAASSAAIEAEILSHLMEKKPPAAAAAAAADHVVAYHGHYRGGLVMDYHAYTLEAVVGRAVAAAAEASGDSALFRLEPEPVVGRARWVDWAGQLVRGLQFIHSAGVVQGDLKPENVLSDTLQAGRLVIADFSSAAFVGRPRSNSAHTPAFSTREVRHGAPAGVANDIYALGLVLAFCAVGEPPYKLAKNARQQLVWMESIAPLDSYSTESRLFLRSIEEPISALVGKRPLEDVLAMVRRLAAGLVRVD